MTDDAGSRRPKGFKIRWKGTPRNPGHRSFCRGATTRYAGAVLRCPGRASGGSTPVLPLLRRSYAPLSGYVQTPLFSFSPWLLDGATLLYIISSAPTRTKAPHTQCSSSSEILLFRDQTSSECLCVSSPNPNHPRGTAGEMEGDALGRHRQKLWSSPAAASDPHVALFVRYRFHGGPCTDFHGSRNTPQKRIVSAEKGWWR